jgi:hypothetical protein
MPGGDFELHILPPAALPRDDLLPPPQPLRKFDSAASFSLGVRGLTVAGNQMCMRVA